jgi:hypothetical protein
MNNTKNPEEKKLISSFFMHELLQYFMHLVTFYEGAMSDLFLVLENIPLAVFFPPAGSFQG